MKKISTVLLLIFSFVCAFANMLPTDWNQWTKDGAGDFNINGNTASVKYHGGQKVAAYKFNANVTGDNYYIFSGEYKRLSEKSVPKVLYVSRTQKNGWIDQYCAPQSSSAKVGEWTKFEVRAYLPDNAVFADFTVGSKGDAVEFRNMKFVKANFNDRSADAPELEYWINMDWNDNVRYANHIGHKSYGEEEIVNFFKLCKQAGVTGVFWRVSVTGQMAYWSKGAATVFPGHVKYELLDKDLQSTVDVLRQIDPLAVAVREAKKNGIKIYVWMTLSDEGYKKENDKGEIIIPDYSFPKFLIDNPDCHLLDRQGKPLYGTIAYSEPKSREYRVNIVKELLEYNADGLYLCTRTHSTINGIDKSGNDYGFNKTVVEEYKKRYGVDILTQDFDVKKFQDIKAEGFDKLIEEIGTLVHAKGQKVILGVSFNGLSSGILGSNWGKMPVHWQKFLQNEWIDGIVSGQYNVEPFFATRETMAFREVAKPHQKLYYWAQMVKYGVGTYSPAKLLKQAEFFAFLQGNGAMYHEAMNLEGKKGQNEKYLFPIGKFYNQFNK